MATRSKVTRRHQASPGTPPALGGQELNPAKADLVLADRGYHWLLVSVAGDDEAARVAACVKPHGAERAQRYGRFVVEELLEHGDEQTQVAESPDRGLDAQTACGRETDRTQRRP